MTKYSLINLNFKSRISGFFTLTINNISKINNPKITKNDTFFKNSVEMAMMTILINVLRQSFIETDMQISQWMAWKWDCTIKLLNICFIVLFDSMKKRQNTKKIKKCKFLFSSPFCPHPSPMQIRWSSYNTNILTTYCLLHTIFWDIMDYGYANRRCWS